MNWKEDDEPPTSRAEAGAGRGFGAAFAATAESGRAEPTARRSLGAALAVLLAAGVPAPASAVAASGAAASSGSEKLIALTFDDGPKPYVLFGTSLPGGPKSPSLLDLLEREHIKATFFVMGWRLEKSADRFCVQKDGGKPCREGAEEEHRLGDEIENHTYGHGDFKRMEKRYGDAWILDDIDRCSRVIQSITGARPRDVRPPDWDLWPALQQKIEARGYHVMTKSHSAPPALRDVDSEDYFCAGPNPSRCPKPSLYDYVLERVEQRERRGVTEHILCFHELPNSVTVLARLIPALEQRGYRFVTLSDYLEAVGESR